MTGDYVCAVCDGGPGNGNACTCPKESAFLTHPFLPAPFYEDRCDAKIDEDGRARTCARPQREHGS